MEKRKYRNKMLMILAIGMQILLLASCKHEDLTIAAPNENIRPAGDFVKNNYEMRLFYAALLKTGFADQLNGTGPFTVLAPTDEAFNRMGVYNPSDFNKMNLDSLKKVIGYHLIPRKLRVSDIPNNGIDVRYATLSDADLYVSRASTNPNGGAENELYFSGSEVTRQDVVLANGSLHVLDNVMKPNFNKTVQAWLAGHPDYSVFVSGLKKFNLWDQLAGTAEFTVFAPNNEALKNVGITAASLNEMDASKYLGDLLFGVYLLYDRHFFVSDTEVFARINSNGAFNYFLKNSSYYMTFGGGKLYPTFKLGYGLTLRPGNGPADNPIKSATSNIVAKNDNLCSNGLVHHLADGMVTPEQAIKK
ncbi:fasciclin domain-containing protein [Pedobacter gandavensis]|uniref:fasciclin domain-containing protein n=1 Tax=Pedobacter gandavensis TaxID=2679963 RepID=UPI002478C12C|nr:fasciclin domain-containing protein [Pedobacter gandavensis]WGQ10902.1 fasciclin domain-containing protein [Pedobacter gandavensis]